MDNREIEAFEGENLLHVCLRNGVYIPNLCHIEGMRIAPASCRLCFVEIEGNDSPLTSCTTKVREGMVVHTGTEAVRNLQRTALELILSTHDIDCARCPANKRCELQKIAGFLKTGLKSKRFEKILKDINVDRTHPLFDYYPNRCVLCGKCVYVCNEKTERPSLFFAKRGMETIISFYGEGDTNFCRSCGACVDICPVSAIIFRKTPSEPT